MAESEFADSAFSNVTANCRHAVSYWHEIQTKKQSLLIKHIQELAKTTCKFICFPSSLHWCIGRVSNKQLIADCITGSYKHWTETSRERTSRLALFPGLPETSRERTSRLALFPGLPCFYLGVCVHNNTREWKTSERQERSGNIIT